MVETPWTAAEKKIARRAYDAALQRELAAVLATLKARAAAATTPQDVWALERQLTDWRHEIDAKYDYRYSRLIRVFGRLMRDGWLTVEDLTGLAEDKLSTIQFLANL